MDVPVVSKDWAHFSTTLAVDASAADSRTGTLTVRLLNYGTLPVYFDSLTVRQSAPGVFIAQEQHYYPFGMNMSGVAVNTQPAGATSKQQYNGGSELEDGLLDAESGNYSTPCRRYDPTLGRFLGVDPLADKYADYSPYNFAFNDPANLNDPSGADALGDLATSNAALTGEGTTIPSMGDGAGGHGETGGQDNEKPRYSYVTINGETFKRDNFPLGRGGDPGGAAAASGGSARGSEGGSVLGAGTLSFGGGSGGGGGRGRTGVVSPNDNTESAARTAAQATLAAIAIDISVPEPTDLYVPKWAVYAVAGAAAGVVLATTSHAARTDNPNPHIVYTIFSVSKASGIMRIEKFGITGPNSGDLKSRPQSQVNSFNRQDNTRVYNWDTTARTQGRMQALFIERALVTTYFGTFGEMPPRQRLPSPFTLDF